METAVGRLTADRPLAGRTAEVVFFEIAGDKQLHINVDTSASSDGYRWLGRSREATDGFASQSTVRGYHDESGWCGTIRDMVFAPPNDAN